MKLISLKCPDCGANLEIEKDRAFCFCSYCGHKIVFNDEVKRSESTYIIRDEARIREAEVEIKEIELEREWRENRKKSIRRWVKICLYSLIICAVLLLFTEYSSINPDVKEKIQLVALIAFDIGGIGFLYGGLSFFISLLSHNKQLQKKK